MKVKQFTYQNYGRDKYVIYAGSTPIAQCCSKSNAKSYIEEEENPILCTQCKRMFNHNRDNFVKKKQICSQCAYVNTVRSEK